MKRLALSQLKDAIRGHHPRIMGLRGFTERTRTDLFWVRSWTARDSGPSGEETS